MTPAECSPHFWRATGRVEVHIEGKFGDPTKPKVELIAHYVRCALCRQMGFKRHPTQTVIYTWRRGDWR